MKATGSDNDTTRARRALEETALRSGRPFLLVLDAVVTVAFSLLVVPSVFGGTEIRLLGLWGLAVSAVAVAQVHFRHVPQIHGTLLAAVRPAVWAAMPWLSFGVTPRDWALVVMGIGGYGVAVGAIVFPQIEPLRRYAPGLVVMVSSYVLALVSAGYWMEAAGLFSVSVHVAFGIWGFETIKGRLLENQLLLEAEAFRDQLTGVGSRRAAIREIQRRISEQTTVHCVVADIDDFKTINTHLGHHGGDTALIAVATALSDTLEDWYVARLGGDEFVAIGDRHLNPSEVEAITTVNVGNVGAGPGTRVLTLSMGATSIDANGTPDQLLSEASAALRRAKSQGKQCMVVADEGLRTEEHDRQSLAAEAREAIESNRIVAWGQPIFAVDSGQAVGVELLARWLRDGNRIVMPKRFVPVIEAQGLAPVLGDLMGRSAIQLLSNLKKLGDHTSFVSFNLSATVLLDTDLPARMAERLRSVDVAPARLVVEITESQQLPSTTSLETAVQRLREVGVGVASDDVGTGWSSLNGMIHAPFTHIKIDRTLITTSDRPGAEDFLSALGGLARGAEQVTIAEGIESPEDLERVRRVGFDLVQGFMLARPTPLGQILPYFGGAQAASWTVGSSGSFSEPQH